jgi:hypothetical protein
MVGASISMMTEKGLDADEKARLDELNQRICEAFRSAGIEGVRFCSASNDDRGRMIHFAHHVDEEPVVSVNSLMFVQTPGNVFLRGLALALVSRVVNPFT